MAMQSSLRLMLYAAALVLLSSVRVEAETPNIVIILADDMGYGDLNCQNPESKIPTPNLDRLAAQGMRFTDAHSPSAVCTPTRYSLLTGNYAWRTSLQRSVLWPWDPPLIDASTLTLPQMLKNKGYATACIGKWHLGWDWPTKDGGSFVEELARHKDVSAYREALNHRIDFSKPIGNGPTTRGFDYYFGDDVPNFPPYVFIEDDRTLGIPNQPKPESMFGRAGLMVDDWDLSAVMPVITEKAVDYIRQTHDTPFFLYLPYTAPHAPIVPAEEFIGKSGAHRYGDFVVEVDWSVGEILRALEEFGHADNTLVIFTSDNGSPQRDGTNAQGRVGSVHKYGHHPSHIYRGKKSDIWEGGHRIPFIARWPERIPAGTISNEIICQVDLMSTIAAITNTTLPATAAVDSYDIGSALFGQGNETPIREALVHHSINGMFAIRQGDWKLIDGRGSGGWTSGGKDDPAPGQLYHLSDDPGETKNRYTEHPVIVDRLRALLSRYRETPTSLPGR